MAVTVEQVKQRILDIVLLCTPQIYDVSQSSVRNIASLPAAVVFTGPAIHDRPSNDVKMTNRDYRILLLVQTYQAGYELTAELACEPFYDGIETVFEERPSLNFGDNNAALAGVQLAYLTGDGGFVVTQLAGVDYASVEFTLRVETGKDVMGKYS